MVSVANLKKLKDGVILVRKKGVHYYYAKKVDKDKFFEGLDKFVRGEWTLCKAAEYVGVNYTTLSKWYNKFLLGQPLPPELFGEKRDNGKQDTTEIR